MIHRADTKNTKFICSELTATPLVLAGITRPAARNAKETLEAISTFIQKTAAREKISPKKAVENGLDGFIAEYAGISNKAVAAVLNVFVPSISKEWHEAIAKIMNAPKDQMEAELKKSPQGLQDYLANSRIGPADFLNSIYDENSDYFYVGTYVDEGLAEIKNKSLQKGQQDRVVGSCN